ncbi:MAG: PASTA domain-containing protein [Bacteroidales bacterium]
MSFKQVIKSFATNIIVRNILLLVVVTGLLIWGVLYWLDSYTLHNQAILVPDVKGLQEEVAAPILKKSKLRYQVVDSVYSRTVEPGAIVEQIPAAESKVKQNRIVFLTVNAKTSQTVELPDVKEISQRQAVASLRSLGFRVDSVEYVPYEYKDLVVNVLYKGLPVNSGVRLPFGATLWLQVGDGFELPEVVDTMMMNDSDKQWFE